jgi:predicted O-methyltransferase YrrM
MVSVVTGTPYSSALDYLNEIDNDEDMKGRIQSRIAESSMRHCYDPVFAVGRRMGWYAFVRILKPKVIIETGVDKGHGSVVLCAALIRNEGEGFPGQYYGTDINPRAGYLLTDPYSRVGKILYGDSLQSLNKIAEIDVFINDSDHSAEYERREYEAILPKLRPGGIILGDNSHATSILAKFSEEHGRQFLFFREQPEDHWYPGAGIGISFEG